MCVCLHGCFIRSGRRVAGGVGRGGDIVDISLALRCRKPQLLQTCISAKYNCTLPQLSRTNVAAHTFWRIWRGRLTGPTVAGQSTVQSGHQRERFTHSEWFTAGFRPFPGPRNLLRCTFFFSTCRISIHGRCHDLPCLTEFSGFCTELFHALSPDQLNGSVLS